MHKIILLPFLLLLIFSCSEEGKKEEKKNSNLNVPTDLYFQDNAISLISNQPNVISYGSIKMNQVLTKGIVNAEIGKSGVMKTTLEDLEKMGNYINMGVPIYYAIQYEDIEGSPLGMMPNILFFGKVKDSKKVISLLKEKNSSASISKSKNYTLIEDGPMAMGVSNDEFIVRIATGNSDGSSKAEMDEMMSDLNRNLKDVDVKANFDESKDITIAYNYEALINMAQKMDLYKNNSELEMNMLTMDLIKSTCMNLAFDKGEMKFIIKSQYTEEMNEFKFFDNDSKNVIEKLGTGEATGALAANINVEEVERFRNKYYPESISNQLNNSNIPMIEEFLPDELPMIEALMMKDGIKSFMDGQFAGALFVEGDKEPEASFNFYMGIGPNLKSMIKENAQLIAIMFDEFELENDHISGYSSSKHATAQGKALSTSKFEDFGNKPISMFIDLTKIPTEGLLSAMDRSLAEYEVLLELIELVTLEFDMNGGEICIKLKDKDNNALTVIMNKLTNIVPNLMKQMI